eukprot:401485-Amphidinium_carterae.1
MAMLGPQTQGVPFSVRVQGGLEVAVGCALPVAFCCMLFRAWAGPKRSSFIGEGPRPQEYQVTLAGW